MPVRIVPRPHRAPEVRHFLFDIQLGEEPSVKTACGMELVGNTDMTHVAMVDAIFVNCTHCLEAMKT